ncbi:hypothetical protein A0H81_14283 [Grifola frondosa]|uniref:Uncharacterized protein n=1 Tax=Grifola frondosa TaxID=5627 RepID=A0A1C7LLY7_GRIFR|nr:hypothetical protein A0H81_14283 [Grifola frondosa]
MRGKHMEDNYEKIRLMVDAVDLTHGDMRVTMLMEPDIGSRAVCAWGEDCSAPGETINSSVSRWTGRTDERREKDWWLSRGGSWDLFTEIARIIQFGESGAAEVVLPKSLLFRARPSERGKAWERTGWQAWRSRVRDVTAADGGAQYFTPDGRLQRKDVRKRRLRSVWTLGARKP